MRQTLGIKWTEKDIKTIIVELDELKLFVHIHYGRKFGRNCSKLGSSCQILINPAEGIFEYGNPYIFSNRSPHYANTNSLVPISILFSISSKLGHFERSKSF